MNTNCQTCNAEWPNDFLSEATLVDSDTSEVVVKKICMQCVEKIELDSMELENTPIFEPRHLMSPYLLQTSTSSCFVR